ncbi:MAG: hypothetical protein K0S32_3242 [Bacteroidetes bacterium]|jgi:hypothetical protein|nr:hypothetical protein [Bacteroidota bacterium]
MRILIALLFCLQLAAQNPSLKISYSYAGIGSNIGKKMYPMIEVSGNTMKYTIETDTAYSKSDWTSKPQEFSVKLKQGALDSVMAVLKGCKDTLVSDYNPCIQNGGIHFMRVSSGAKRVNYELTNTFNLTALKFARVLNRYIPKGYGIWATEKDVKETFDCWTTLRGKWNVKQKPDTVKHVTKKP